MSEIRQNPALENIAKIIECEQTHALIRMLITYEKYNFETEEYFIEKTMNRNTSDMMIDDDTVGMLSETDEPPFKEIELMKELVLEIGSAINDRIKEDLPLPGSKMGSPSPRRPETFQTPASPRDNEEP